EAANPKLQAPNSKLQTPKNDQIPNTRREPTASRESNWSLGPGASLVFGVWVLELLMRLAFLTHEPFYPPSGGGSAEAVYLVQEMIQRGHQVHLFCPAFPEPEKVKRLFAEPTAVGASQKPTPDPSQEGNRPANRTPSVGAGVGLSGPLECHLFKTWQMGRYTSLRNFKYLA